jgi:DivIVA domain-containing protein
MPDERRLTITSSPHLAPDDVARHTFASVRRGFDPTEVRDYLESLAAGLRSFAEREQELRDALAAAEERAANPVIDDTMLTAAVGKETARVLQSAHDAAAEMVANAEAETTRLTSEARAESERLLAEAAEVNEQAHARADALLAERTAEAEAAAASLQERTEHQVAAALDKVRADAEELTERARAEGRVMVEEAQQLRARVLADLSRRRKVLHAQIEQLRAGRERLAETITEVRHAVDAIAEDLFNAENEARLAAEVAGREMAGRTDDQTPEDLAAALLAEEAAADREDRQVVGPAADAGGAPAGGPDQAGAPAAAEPVTAGAPTPPVEKVDALFAKLRAAQGDEAAGEDAGADVAAAGTPGTPPPAEAPVAPGATATAARADGDATAEDATDGDANEEDAGPPEARHPLAVQRDESVAPIITGLSRRLKRALQDSQNDLLDKLRAKGTTWSPDLLPEETEQVDSVSTAVLPFLEEAADAGAALVGGSEERPSADTLLGLAHELAASIVLPLRRRLSEPDGLDGAEEAVVTEHVGAAYREWKGERIVGLAGDHVVAAVSLGTLAALGTGGPGVEWVAAAAAGGTPCPDCEDNGLNGAQAAGEEFPTGHTYPPAHPGCRCLLAPGTP